MAALQCFAASCGGSGGHPVEAQVSRRGKGHPVATAAVPTACVLPVAYSFWLAREEEGQQTGVIGEPRT